MKSSCPWSIFSAPARCPSAYSSAERTSTTITFGSFIDDEAKELGKTTYYVSLPGKGQDPHAIAIPVKWSWPLEKVSVIAAYPKFRNWAQDMTNVKAQDWYLYLDSDKVMRIE